MKLNKLALPLVLTSFACAQEFTTQFNYFGNLTGSVIDKSGYTVKNIVNTDVDTTFNMFAYSKVGGQITTYNDKYSFYAQAVAYENDGVNELEISWLNAKYQATPNFSFKLGRMQHSLFLNSRSTDLDYVHTWIKAPVEIYSMMPLRAVDAVELNYEKMFGQYYVDFRYMPYAKAKTSIDILDKNAKAEAQKIKSAALSVQKDNLTFKMNYSTANYNVDSSIIPNLETIKSTLKALGNDVDRFSLDDKKISFLTYGIDYSFDNFTITSEYLDMHSKSLVPDVKAYTTLLSYRVKKFTPYVMYAKNINDKDFYSVDDIVIPTTLPTAQYQQAQQAKAAMESILYGMNCSQQTTSFGLRYDYKVGVAFKAQLDRITFSNFGNHPLSANDSYERRGYLYQEKGVAKKPVYQFTVGMSFAF